MKVRDVYGKIGVFFRIFHTRPSFPNFYDEGGHSVSETDSALAQRNDQEFLHRWGPCGLKSSMVMLRTLYNRLNYASIIGIF